MSNNLLYISCPTEDLNALFELVMPHNTKARGKGGQVNNPEMVPKMVSKFGQPNKECIIPMKKKPKIKCDISNIIKPKQSRCTNSYPILLVENPSSQLPSSYTPKEP